MLWFFANILYHITTQITMNITPIIFLLVREKKPLN